MVTFIISCIILLGPYLILVGTRSIVTFAAITKLCRRGRLRGTVTLPFRQAPVRALWVSTSLTQLGRTWLPVIRALFISWTVLVPPGVAMPSCMLLGARPTTVGLYGGTDGSGWAFAFRTA